MRDDSYMFSQALKAKHRQLKKKNSSENEATNYGGKTNVSRYRVPPIFARPSSTFSTGG